MPHIQKYQKIKKSLHHENRGSDNGLAAAWIKEDGQENLYYFHKDHLGSICAITDQNQNIVAEYSFDVWGNRRNANNWDLTDNPDQSFTNRGFTGHVSEANILQGEAAAEYPAELIPIVKRIGEHIDEFRLINMNGRVYDPTIGMFLSPDNYVQMPDFSAGFNRYSYAMNNPLVYTDPDGEIIGTAVTFFGDLLKTARIIEEKKVY